MTDMRRLSPTGSAASDLEIADWYSFGPGTTLRVNMVMTLDGAAVASDGGSKTLSGPADTHLLGLLRALADAVVVAAGTIRAEHYNPIRTRENLVGFRAEHGLSNHPPLVMITRSTTLSPSNRVLAQAPTRPIVLTLVDDGSLHEVAEVVVCPEEDGFVDLAWAKAYLAERGLRRLHSEGGPALLGGFLAADLLDEYLLTISPRTVGGGAEVLRPVSGLPVPREFALVDTASADDFLFLRYRRR